ncbi:MAG: ATP-binding protein [Dehalococcoidia bacterium]
MEVSASAVAIVGPRQVGKTTLAKLFAGTYFDLEMDADRTRVDIMWDDLSKARGLVVLDEAQVHPAIFPRLRAAIDQQRKRNGRFLLLGSVGPDLMRDVSESLAGRLSIVELTPFLLPELGSKRLRNLWLWGGFPDSGVLHSASYPTWARDYLTLLAQRDLPAWGLPAKPNVTLRLFRMLAAVHGQEWNASSVGSSLGVTYHTINSYVDYLEGAFLIRRLRPFHANLKKRLVKRPKVYWRDPGSRRTCHLSTIEYSASAPSLRGC